MASIAGKLERQPRAVSGLWGVYPTKNGKKWRAELFGKKVGRYDTPERAARVRDRAVVASDGSCAPPEPLARGVHSQHRRIGNREMPPNACMRTAFAGPIGQKFHICRGHLSWVP